MRKTLPDDFQKLLSDGDLDALKAVFETCQINAYERYSKTPALALRSCPDKLTYWLVEKGADVMTLDIYGQTPLHCRASYREANIAILLELGADLNLQSPSRGSPLHCTVGQLNMHHAKTLIDSGADVNARNRDGNTALDLALLYCSSVDLPNLVPYAEFFLKAGAIETPDMKTSLTGIGTSFEFRRSEINPEYIEAMSDALFRLYDLFNVDPVPRRKVQDGIASIAASFGSVDERHFELGQLLVPPSGAADTVQGEVIRISGKIYRELNHHGGVNWGSDFRKMAKAFSLHIRSAKRLSTDVCDEAERVIQEIETGYGDAEELLSMALDWVSLNPKPIKLSKPDYSI
ncbi:MAG: ankyrin repeat domain-containing protein [Hyphomicrobiales bacterium]